MNTMSLIQKGIAKFKSKKMRDGTLIYINGCPYVECPRSEKEISINLKHYRKASAEDIENLFRDYILHYPRFAIPFAYSDNWENTLRRALIAYELIRSGKVPDKADDIMQEIHEIAEGGWRGLADYFGSRILAADVLYITIESFLTHTGKCPPVRIGDIKISIGHCNGTWGYYETYRITDGERTADVERHTSLPGDDSNKLIYYGLDDIFEFIGLKFDVTTAVRTLMFSCSKLRKGT